MTTTVTRDGRWPFAWAFRVYDASGEFVYGEEHIESRRAAQKDADDIVLRLSDGRLRIASSGLVYAESRAVAVAPPPTEENTK